MRSIVRATSSILSTPAWSASSGGLSPLRAMALPSCLVQRFALLAVCCAPHRCRATTAVRLGIASLFACLALGITSPAWADPSAHDAAHLLTDRTVLFLHLNDAHETAERMRTTGLGAAMEDEKVRPLIEQLWGSVVPQLEALEERAGMKLLDLLDRLQGRLTLAVINIPAQPPALAVFLSEIENDKLDALLADMESSLANQGFELLEESIDDIPTRRWSRSGSGAFSEIIRIDRPEYRLLVTDPEVAARLMRLHERDSKDSSLEELNSFRAIMSRCSPDNDSADIAWFVDPIGLVRALGRNNSGVTTGLALLPAIGVDGLQAVGGRISFGEPQFEYITRTHVLMEPPREGVLRMLAISDGPTEPENWVAAETSQYTTWHIRWRPIYDTASELFDSFRGDGALAREIKNRVSEPLGADLIAEVLPELTGRVTQTVSYEQPVTLQSQSSMIGIELEDAEKFRPTLQKILEKWSDRQEKKNFAGIEYYQWSFGSDESTTDEANGDPPRDDQDDNANRRRQRMRPPKPTLAVLGNWLVMSDRASTIEKAILADQGGTPRLRDELDFKLVSSKLRQQLSVTPGMLKFVRPEDNLRFLYQLLQSDDMVERIHERREENPFLTTLDEMLQQKKLPAFAVVAQYLAPGGSMIVNEETGLYHVGFGLRRK